MEKKRETIYRYHRKINHELMKVFILAGGSGTRLWPYSQTSLPKQFLRFGAKHTLLQKTYLRFVGLIPTEHISIVTQKDYAERAQKQINELGYSVRIQTEPEQRNTAPAIAWMVKSALEDGFLNSNDLFFITPSDHYLSNSEELHQALAVGAQKAQEGAICLFGITPRRPATGYGYIQAETPHDISAVQAFHEKPTRSTAESFIRSNKMYWNAGMFLFYLPHFFQEIQKHSDELHAFFEGKKSFYELTKTSIDYALMEKTRDAYVVRLHLTWSDVGSWDGVYEASEKDAEENVVLGEGYIERSTNCLICSEKQKVILSEVENLLVLVSENEVVVTHRNADVKAILCSQEAQALDSSEAYLESVLHPQT